VVTRLEPEKAEKPERPEKPERLSRKERAELKAALAKANESDEPEDATKAEPLPLVPQAAPDEEPEFDPVEPAREARPAARNETIKDSVRMLPAVPTIPAQRAGDAPVVVARVDDFVPDEPRPADNAVIGPLISAARHRARLSIDTLSERTRIRPHVLECIEVDDFAACGGDFYARGHLRTLARIFGLDPQQLLDLYDDHYASAEIEARQVFEAELATGIGGGVRAIRTGPRWSLLAACVLALATVWGAARVFNDTPQELVSPAPGVVDSAGLAGSAETDDSPKMTLAPLEVSADGASPQVVVRDRDGRILWAGKLADGQH
jgi:cytoskeleton protein RodZ